jgi:hypothetical protein
MHPQKSNELLVSRGLEQPFAILDVVAWNNNGDNPALCQRKALQDS